MKKNFLIVFALLSNIFGYCQYGTIPKFIFDDRGEDYNILSLSYEFMHFSEKSNPANFKAFESDNINGLGLNYIHGFSFSRYTPLYYEVGGNFSAFFDKTDGVSTYLLRLSVTPAGLAYRINLSDNVYFVPNLGLDAHINLLAESKVSDININYFRKDLFGSFKWQRVQIGWHVGLRIMVEDKFSIGLRYGTDFIPISYVKEDNLKYRMETGNLSATIGLNF